MHTEYVSQSLTHSICQINRLLLFAKLRRRSWRCLTEKGIGLVTMNRNNRILNRVYFSELLVSFEIKFHSGSRCGAETCPTHFCFWGTWASLTSQYMLCFYYGLAHSEAGSCHSESMHYVVVICRKDFPTCITILHILWRFL